MVVLTPIKIAASLIPGGPNRIEVIENELLGSDLNISSLKEIGRLKAFSGFTAQNTGSGKIVFPEGMEKKSLGPGLSPHMFFPLLSKGRMSKCRIGH